MITRKKHEDGCVSWIHTDGRWELTLPDGKEIEGIARTPRAARELVKEAREQYAEMVQAREYMDQRVEQLNLFNQLTGGALTQLFGGNL